LLTLASSAQADVVKPLVVLGPAELTINGQPAAVDAAASFAATVNLDGASRLTLAVRSEGETMTTSIPLTTNTVGPGGLLAPSVLADLEQAAVTILKPLDGFTSLDNLPLTVEGSVLDKDRLTDLKVNEVEVLGQIGADHRYSVQVPGTSKAITLSFTDRQGVTQRTEVPAEHVPASAPSTPASQWAERSRRARRSEYRSPAFATPPRVSGERSASASS
jgi:hypothetical protein